MSFIEGIKEQARKDKKTIALPESEDERTIRAAAKVLEEGTADLILVGSEEEAKKMASDLGVNIDGAKFVDPATSEDLDSFVETLYELRKHKGMTPEKARETLLSDKTTFACMLVKTGAADGLVSGACHSTANTLRPALQILRTAPGAKLVSGFFVMDVPNCEYGENGVFVFADCGLNQDPDPDQLAAIANDSAASFKKLVGADAKVAFISHSTKGSAKHALVDKVVAAVNAAHEQYPDLNCDGEMQVDAAIVPLPVRPTSLSSRTSTQETAVTNLSSVLPRQRPMAPCSRALRSRSTTCPVAAPGRISAVSLPSRQFRLRTNSALFYQYCRSR